jgi:GAF domain-containing protein
MLNRVRDWLSVPVFELDEEKTRVVRLLNVVLIALGAGSFLNFIISLITQNTSPPVLALILLFCFFILWLNYLMRSGRVRLTSVLLVIAISALTTISLANSGTIRQTILTYYILSSILAGLLIGRRAALTSAIIHSLVVFGLVWVEMSRPVPVATAAASLPNGLAFAVGNIVAVVLLNLSMRSIDDALARERGLNEISRTVSGMFDLSTSLSTIVQMAAKQVGAEAGVLGLVSPDGQFIEQHVLYNMPENLGLEKPIPRGQGMGWQVVENGQGVVMSDYANSPSALPEWVAAGVHGFIDVPLLVGDACLGVLGIFTFSKNKKFTRRDFDLAESIGRQMGIAIQNARLFDAERKRANQQEALRATLADLSRELEMPKLLQEVLERAVRLSGTDVGELALYDESMHNLVITACFGLEKNFAGTRLALGEGTMGMAAQTLDTIIVSDYQTWEKRSTKYGDSNFHAALAMPLLFGDRLLGTLALGYTDPRQRFGPADIQLIGAYALQAAIAIQNARLFDAERQRANQQEALRATLADLSRELEISKLLHLVLQRAVRLSGTDAGELGIFDEKTRTVEIAASYGLGQDFTGTTQAPGEGVMGMAALTRQAVIVSNYKDWGSRAGAYSGTPVQAALAMPLFYGERLLGVLALGYFDPQKQFSPTDVQFINPYAIQAAIAIQNARMFGAAQRQLSELRILHAAALAGTQAAHEEMLIEHTFSIIRESLPAAIFDILLWDEKANGLQERLSSPGTSKNDQRRIFHIGEGVVGTVAKTRKPWRIGDVRKVPEYISMWDGILSELCLPISIGERLLGVLNLESKQLNAFSEADERLLSTLAGQLAVAIDRLRAEVELRQLNTQLEQRVLDRTAALEAANRELESFAYSVSHDLRAPLRGINGFGRMLAEDYQESLGEEGRSLLTKMLESAARMDELIADLLQFSRLSRQAINRQPVTISKMVEQIINELNAVTPDRQIEWQVGELPDCMADPSLLRQVLINLLENSVKYTSGRARAVIQVGSQQENGGTVYFVRDNGAGFNMKYAHKLFGVFQRLHSEHQFEGTGIGLATVGRIIARHGGKIWADAEVEKGATFYFTLPTESTGIIPVL